jgi:hypothetical protein
MLKVMEEPKLNSYPFPCSLRQNSDGVFVLPSLSSVDVLSCTNLLKAVTWIVDLHLGCSNLI